MMEWIAMEGDGIYVWPCYILTLVVLVGNVIAARMRHGGLLARVDSRRRHDRDQVGISKDTNR